MKIKLTGDWTYYRVNEEIEVAEDLARRLIEAKKAVCLDGALAKAKSSPNKTKMVSAPMEMK